MSEWTDLSADEVLTIAIIMEREGRAFYRQAVERANDPSGRAMFSYLAEEEERHLELFRSELRKLRGNDGEVDPDADEESRLRSLGGVLEIFKIDRGINPGMEETDVLTSAAGIEKEVYLFYRRAAGETKSPETEGVLQRLAEEEWGHYQMVSTILEGLTETGQWTSHEQVRGTPPPSGGEWSLDEWQTSWSIEVGSLYTCSNCSSMIMVTKGGVGTLAPECCGLPMVKTSPGASGGGS